MRTHVDCIACKVRQAADVIKGATDDPLLQEKALKTMLGIISGLSFERSPVAIRRDVENVVKDILKVDDPYLKHKEFSNRIGKLLYPELKKIVKDSDNPQKTAIKLAVTGNIIDFGMFKYDEVTEEKVRKTVESAMELPSSLDDSDKLIERIDKAEDIWFIADNCGELFFDRVLIEEMPTEKITVVVRGNPILNDATLADAEFTGLTDIVKVVGDGYDAPALILEDCSPEVREGFFNADLVVAKGQGNYEALSLVEREIFFLLMVKCHVVADDIGCAEGEMIIRRGGVFRQ
ncbi:MAG: DUF89 family protein [candidate division Zixibacteria bacterium]|nr:DUF89 family protein [candidate division Zixibacteria bacterium]